MTKVSLENLKERSKLELIGLKIVKPRRTNGRILCDVTNLDGELVLSGEANWVIDTCYDREYYIENWTAAVAKLDELNAYRGTF